MDHDKFSLKDAMLDPSKVFGKPIDVSVDPRLSNEEKREILQSWKANEEALLRASNEGLGGGERPHLQLVTVELQKLDSSS